MEFINFIFFLYDFLCSILYVYRCAWAVLNHLKVIHISVVWGVGKFKLHFNLNLWCGNITIVVHCGMWSCPKCRPAPSVKNEGPYKLNSSPLYEVIITDSLVVKQSVARVIGAKVSRSIFILYNICNCILSRI